MCFITVISSNSSWFHMDSVSGALLHNTFKELPWADSRSSLNWGLYAVHQSQLMLFYEENKRWDISAGISLMLYCVQFRKRNRCTSRTTGNLLDVSFMQSVHIRVCFSEQYLLSPAWFACSSRAQSDDISAVLLMAWCDVVVLVHLMHVNSPKRLDTLLTHTRCVLSGLLVTRLKGWLVTVMKWSNTLLQNYPALY